MKQHVYRRRRAKLPTDRVCPPPTRSGGDGRALTAILVAQAIDGGVYGGIGRVGEWMLAAICVDGRLVAAMPPRWVGGRGCGRSGRYRNSIRTGDM